MIEPVTHRIVVKPEKLFEQDPYYKSARAAGIELPQEQFKREQEGVDVGTVVSFGPTAFRDFGTENPLAVGVKIVYARYGGKKVTDPESKEDFLILNDEDVIAILK